MKWKRLKRKFRFNKKKHFMYLFLFCVLGSIGLGYAYLNTNLAINGLSALKSSTWDIYFDNVVVDNGSVTATTEPTITDKTNISFSVELDDPGDSYDFTVDIVNDGSIDAVLSSFEILPVLTDEEKKYFEYTVLYSNNQELKVGDGLAANSSKKLKIHAEYKTSDNLDDYPLEDKSFNFSLGLSYQQGIVNTLYEVLETEALKNGLAREYTGSHQDSMDASKSTQKIYYYYGSNNTNGTAILDKNNVLFAGQCWQMIRTTDTGGVKMIYNGEAEDGKCLNTRGTHVGYASRTSTSLASSYWYGTDYTYDSTAKTFKVSGTTEQVTWNATTGPGLVGKYTCKNTNVDGTCSTLYLVESYYNTTSAYVIPLNSNSNYSQFGTLQFNASYNSPSYVGYMYNTVYPYNLKAMTSSESMLSSSSLATTYWYANSVTWGTPTASRYNLDSPYQVSATTDYPSLVGEYTFRNATQTYTSTTVQYIAAVNNSTYYYISMYHTGNHTLADFNYTYTYGDSYTDNGDGTYTINSPTTVERKNWYTSYSSVGANKYVCKNAVNDTCSELWYTTETSNMSMKYIKVANNYKYSKGFTWDGSKYVLDNDASTSFWNINDSTNKTSINNAHYTCWNETGECTTISYIYYISETILYYINITDGKSVEDTINEMLHDNGVNQVNSTMKSGVDAWYKHYILEDYDDYIEDTIFCNDRSIKALNGWNPDGGITNSSLQFKEYNVTSDLSCTNTTDRFSISNNNAKLTYKVGLMSSPEMNIMNNNNARKTRQIYWLASPLYFSGNLARGWYVYASGVMQDDHVGYAYGVRPAISLRPGIEYSDGDGSMANPYVVDSNIIRYSNSGDNDKGVSISDLGTLYKNPTDAFAAFDKKSILKHTINNNRVVATDVSFERNGVIYTLKSEGATYNEVTEEYNDDSIYYEKNKQTLNKAFGESYCTEYTSSGKYYQCIDGDTVVAVRASGRVGAQINSLYCRVFQDGSFQCA